MSEPMIEAINDVMKIAPYTEIAHHLPGRIRLTVKISGIGLVQKMDLPAALRYLPGVLSFRVNAFARSIVIDYDKDRLPFDLWESLVQIGHRPELEDPVRERLLVLANDGAPS